MLKGIWAVVGSKSRVSCSPHRNRLNRHTGDEGNMGRHPFFVLLSCDLQGSSMSIIQLNGALQGDHGSLAAAPAHIRVPKLTHIAVPR